MLFRFWEESHIRQFLMNLHLELEAMQATLMNVEVSLDLDASVQKVLGEEIHLQSHMF